MQIAKQSERVNDHQRHYGRIGNNMIKDSECHTQKCEGCGQTKIIEVFLPIFIEIGSYQVFYIVDIHNITVLLVRRFGLIFEGFFV